MTTTITTPKNVVPVGLVTIGGTTYDVKQHPEFVRFFFDLFRRVGGGVSLSNSDLEALIIDASVAPYQAGDAPQRFADSLLTPSVEPLSVPDTPDARVQALEARVDDLARQLNDLQQGYQL